MLPKFNVEALWKQMEPDCKENDDRLFVAKTDKKQAKT